MIYRFPKPAWFWVKFMKVEEGSFPIFQYFIARFN